MKGTLKNENYTYNFANYVYSTDETIANETNTDESITNESVKILYSKNKTAGSENINGWAYLKYVLAGPAIHTKINDNAGNITGIYLLLLLVIKNPNTIKYNHTTKPIFKNIPITGIYGKTFPYPTNPSLNHFISL